MTSVKLDSGDYINTDNVCEIYHLNSTKKPDKTTKITWWIVMALTSESHHHRHITIADRDRIVEAMTPQKVSRERLVNTMLTSAQAITDLSAILSYTSGGIDISKALRDISEGLSREANT